GLQDPRAQTLTAYIDIVKHLRPKTILLENVRDLVAAGGGVGGIELLQSSFNEINKTCGTNYRLQVIHVNAADYGVPQIRHRVFIFASVDGRHIALPPPSHGPNREYPYTTAWDAIGDLDVEDWPEELRVTGKWADL